MNIWGNIASLGHVQSESYGEWWKSRIRVSMDQIVFVIIGSDRGFVPIGVE